MKNLFVSSLFSMGVALTPQSEIVCVGPRSVSELRNTTAERICDTCFNYQYSIPFEGQKISPTQVIEIPKKEPIPEVVTIDTKALIKSPLARKGISPTLSNLLGQNQAEQIIAQYNPHLKEKYKKPSNLTYTEIDELKIPLVFDDLKSIFPKDIQTFISNNPDLKVSQDRISDPYIFVVKGGKTGKYALAYYDAGILQLATHASPGKKSGPKMGKNGEMLSGGVLTPEGLYFVQYKEINKSSRKFENAPMSYALNIKDGFFIHTGNTNGTPLSHGCVRIPGLYAQQLFTVAQKGTKILISFSGAKDISLEKSAAINTHKKGS